ncbi:DUF418 domain-containing protein [Pseudoalteromonas sp. A25]|uniref:DUF418 domain-containing protein n=1 Tax=Pseudoalteromonas sp. A25 TaxID=116092 RepID=UPI0012608C81|nr:DUF418 domain-containing protein [Pseudoalteromonas sp. A25]BBN83286.1 DUF418 domain-containing protein [Pseudoalteromonas sp. A25]
MNRISQLDSLRGIAVLGLLLLNSYYFALFETGYVRPQVPVLSDQIIQYLNLLLLDSRFRTLFCMLFGAALVIQFSKRNNIESLKPRLIAIGIIGILHSIFVWPGDILLSYGIAGFLALSYLNANNQRVLHHGIALFFLSCTLLLLLSFTSTDEMISRQSAQFELLVTSAPSDLPSLLIHNVAMTAIMLLMLPILTLWNALGLMLIGMYCFKKQIFTLGLNKAHLTLTISAIFILSATSIALETIDGQKYAGINEALVWVNALFGALLVTHLNAKISFGRVLLMPVQAVGKVALTCYLMQSFIMICYFVWLNPQARASYNRIDYVELAFVGIALQLLLAPLYTRYFTHGPFEYVLKHLSLKIAQRHKD